MCISSVLHHHHVPPCPRPLAFVTHCLYCPDATVNPLTSEVVAPCANVVYTPDHGVNYDDPCSTGGCIVSPQCSTGTCRLQDLGGRWVCCACRRGGNVYRTCTNRKVGSPDTFCYHDVCQTCKPDGSPGKESTLSS
ncbi:hypothetical protein TOPH_05982 [Tolypocladium ophioglossoides CBS 100239]|uniref:Uncharacterized protein n=1 Tax=Tolypocladium ophioglossoides (strain CBS 100239) TaxID=1163406 RepID=A0A0L0N5R4_TOLOC|nr:hypothetical protein TOPH_05982 [Tolypocladium ophioglossoides CBS 100239]